MLSYSIISHRSDVLDKMTSMEPHLVFRVVMEECLLRLCHLNGELLIAVHTQRFLPNSSRRSSF